MSLFLRCCRGVVCATCTFGLVVVGGCSEETLPPQNASSAEDPADTPEWMIVGLDQKVTWGNEGVLFSAGGSDRVVIYDIANRRQPVPVVDLNLSNSVFGPPVNLAISPNHQLALIADSTVHVPDDTGGWTWEPATGLHVLDLTADPPAFVETLEVDRQPSGLTFVGDELALVANRNSQSLSVLSIDEQNVSQRTTLSVGGEPIAAVAVTPNGLVGVAAKFQEQGKLSFFDIVDGEVTYRGTEQDIEVGAWPYNVAITPNGRLALTADNGANGASDGQTNTVSVVDLQTDPPTRVAQVPVGDGPEGLAISPTGQFAVVALIDGSNAPADAAFKKDVGSVVLLAIEETSVRVVGAPVPVGALPEGVVFSADGQFVYIGNYLSQSISILEIVDGQLVDTGQSIQTPGQPGSMR